MAQGQLIPSDWAAITPSDTLAVNLIGFYVGGTGNVTAITGRGNSVLFSSLPVGALIVGEFTKIMSAGTTATLIVGAKP